MKEAMLLALCARAFQAGRTIVFFRTKKRAHRAKMLFGLAGLSQAAELHGDMTQASRLDSLERFRKVNPCSPGLHELSIGLTPARGFTVLLELDASSALLLLSLRHLPLRLDALFMPSGPNCGAPRCPSLIAC